MSGERGPQRVAVVGGGLAGLAAARRLTELAALAEQELEVLLFEATDRLGGKVGSEWSAAGVLVERGPDSFLARKPALLELIEAVGLTEQLTGSIGPALSSAIYRDGRMRRLPPGMGALVPTDLGAFLRSDLLSLPGRLRALADLWLPPPPGEGDLSLRQLIGPRLGREYLEVVAEPLIAGVHGGRADDMSVAATMPGLLGFLRRDGSLMRGARRQAGQAAPSPRPAFMSLVGGMGSLISALEGHLGPVCQYRQAEVSAVRSRGRQLSVAVGARGTGGGEEWVDAVILATPAEVSARLLREGWPELARPLGEIRHYPLLTITYAYAKGALAEALPGQGWLVPGREGLTLRGATVMTSKWPQRARSDQLVAIRAFLGGPSQTWITDRSDAELEDTVAHEIGKMTGIQEAPLEATVVRIEDGNPAYRLGHLDRLAEIERQLAGVPQLALAGASYRGIGLSDVARSGQEAALRVWNALGWDEDGPATVIG